MALCCCSYNRIAPLMRWKHRFVFSCFPPFQALRHVYNWEIDLFGQWIEWHGTLEFSWVFNQLNTIFDLPFHEFFVLLGKNLDAQLFSQRSGLGHILVKETQDPLFVYSFDLVGNLLQSFKMVAFVQNDMPIARRLLPKIFVLGIRGMLILWIVWACKKSDHKQR